MREVKGWKVRVRRLERRGGSIYQLVAENPDDGHIIGCFHKHRKEHTARNCRGVLMGGDRDWWIENGWEEIDL